MDQRTALVTGATSGIGRATAVRLAASGYHVIAAGRRATALMDLTERAGAISGLTLDVTDAASVVAAASRVDELTRGHGVDVLVNSAGIARLGPAEVIPDEVLRAQFETNVFGPMAVIRAFVPAMRARRSGRIINISSVLGRVTFPSTGVYSASKFALESLSDALRAELAPFGVSVVLVEPGVVKTGLADEAGAAAAEYAAGLAPYAGVLPQRFGLPKSLTDRAVTSDAVADVIVKAVTAKRPDARYPVGAAARRNMWLLTRMPTRMSDRAKSRIFGVGSPPAPARRTSTAVTS
jgi:NAD(P)-dependent dehydrogenase (short-subunit alcohol dehydrogenase family)